MVGGLPPFFLFFFRWDSERPMLYRLHDGVGYILEECEHLLQALGTRHRKTERFQPLRSMDASLG